MHVPTKAVSKLSKAYTEVFRLLKILSYSHFCHNRYSRNYLIVRHHFFIFYGDRISEGSVHERLDKDAIQKRSEEERRVRERADLEMQGATFRPQVPPSSVLIVRRKSIFLDNPSGEGGQCPSGSVHRRLSTAHTMSSSAAIVEVSSSTSSSPSPQKSTSGKEKWATHPYFYHISQCEET